MPASGNLMLVDDVEGGLAAPPIDEFDGERNPVVCVECVPVRVTDRALVALEWHVER